MRKEFAAWLSSYGAREDRFVLMSGDLGFQALEGVRDTLGPRFINAGVSEQNMISVAAGLASEGMRAMAYSIAPFAVFRPAEQIRLDVCIHNLDVKVVGNGGGYGYGIMGSTHHALEDLAVLSSFPNMACFVPVTGDDVAVCADAMMAITGPSYLRLNLGALPAGFTLSRTFAAVRRIEGPTGVTPTSTVVALGPIALNALKAEVPAGLADVFVVSQLPVPQWPAEMWQSIRRTGHVVVLEEHVERGGLAEHLALAMLKAGIMADVDTRAALGYPGKVYGSQAFHQRESGLDPESIAAILKGRI